MDETKNSIAVDSDARNAIPAFTDKMCAAILDHLAERDRLRKLTNAELVAECLQTDSADYPVVEEMMDRLDPEWFEEKSEK